LLVPIQLLHGKRGAQDVLAQALTCLFVKGLIGGRLKNNFSLHGHIRRLSAQSAELFAGMF